MDIITSRNTLALFKLITSKGRIEPLTPPRKVKETFTGADGYEYFERVTPESVGISSEKMRNFLTELKETRSANVNTVSVMRGGKVICGAEYYPYRFDTWHVMYSYSKTVTAYAIGILVGQGLVSVNDNVHKFFPDTGLSALNIGLRNLKVEHLLNMTSGVKFNEVGSAVETDWVKCFLESVPKTEPGSTFEYNSMNTYMLSAIVTSVTKRTLEDFLEEYLFGPMEIKYHCWERCPKGICCGGWGLYLLPEDMAKMGQLLLQNGKWGEKQLIPEDFIREMKTSHANVPAYVSSLTYGYQMWISRSPDFYCLNGMLGQNTLVFPESGVVISLTGGSENMFHDNVTFDICRKYFSCSFPEKLPANKKAYAALKKAEKRFRRPPYVTPKLIRKLHGGDMIPKECRKWDGKEYSFSPKEAANMGILPFTIQCAQNNYSAGIRRISFRREKFRFYMNVTEGDRIYNLPVGFERARYADLKIGENTYRAAIMGKFMTDDDGYGFLKIAIHYLEMGAVRNIKLYPECDDVIMHFSEMPSHRFLMNLVDHVVYDIKNFPLIKGLLESGGADMLEYTAKKFFEPSAKGKGMTPDAENTEAESKKE